jgi:hypothetical protein
MSSMSTADAYNAGFVTGEYIERERILALLETQLPRVTGCGCCMDADLSGAELIALIKGEQQNPLQELQRLAEKTGEYKNFDNPLIDKDD